MYASFCKGDRTRGRPQSKNKNILKIRGIPPLCFVPAAYAVMLSSLKKKLNLLVKHWGNSWGAGVGPAPAFSYYSSSLLVEITVFITHGYYKC